MVELPAAYGGSLAWALRVRRYIEQGQAQGARLLCGGQRVVPDSAACAGGYFVQPTILECLQGEADHTAAAAWGDANMHAHAADNLSVVQEEIFGPVMCVLPFDTEDEAVRRANGGCRAWPCAPMPSADC